MLKVDISGLLAADLAEVARIKGLKGAVLSTAKAAASVERSTHRYRNRTGRLEGLTRADDFGGADEWSVDLHMGAFYGAFVQALGYSEFRTWGEQAAAQIDRIMRGAAGG